MSTVEQPNDQVTQQENNVAQSKEMSLTEFNKKIRKLRNDIVRASKDHDGHFDSSERNILLLATQYFSSNEADWYQLDRIDAVDFMLLFDTFSQPTASDNKNVVSMVALPNYGISELTLAMYIFKLRFEYSNTPQLPPEVINYIPDHYTSDPKKYDPFYSKWLKIPVTVATLDVSEQLQEISRSKNTAINLIQQSEDLLDEVSGQSEALEKEFQKKSSRFQKILDASIKKLASSYSSFVWSKRLEKYGLILVGCYIAWLMYSIATISIDQGNIKAFLSLVPEWIITKNENATLVSKLAATFSSSFALIVAEGLLLYFFRIILNNYYAARDELLQLQLRTALCKFAPQYKEFAGNSTSQTRSHAPQTEEQVENQAAQATNGEASLDEFAKHIFSPLNSRMNPAPHPLDFLGQVTEAVKKVKN